MNPHLQETLASIASVQLPDGGFENFQGEGYHTEATIWATLALKQSGKHQSQFLKGCSRLARDQNANGAVEVEGLYPDAWWPTSLSIFCWHLAPEFESHKKLAAQFLLTHAGITYPHDKKKKGHDSSILGWPWIESTHSWIDPTAFAIIALKLCGYSTHPRVQEGIRMIMDRQLPEGTWNYGNTVVYDNILKWLPENTATALCGLAGFVEKTSIEKGLLKLESEIPLIRTPWTFAWSMMALHSWRRTVKDRDAHFIQCLAHQQRCGNYGTSLLGLLSASWLMVGGIDDLDAKGSSL